MMDTKYVSIFIVKLVNSAFVTYGQAKDFVVKPNQSVNASSISHIMSEIR